MSSRAAGPKRRRRPSRLGVTGAGAERLIQAITDRLPEGPKYYPDEWVTDQPERFVVAELIREKVLHHMEEEVPHAVAVYVERMAEREGQALVDIDAPCT